MAEVTQSRAPTSFLRGPTGLLGQPWSLTDRNLTLWLSLKETTPWSQQHSDWVRDQKLPFIRGSSSNAKLTGCLWASPFGDSKGNEALVSPFEQRRKRATSSATHPQLRPSPNCRVTLFIRLFSIVLIDLGHIQISRTEARSHSDLRGTLLPSCLERSSRKPSLETRRGGLGHAYG